MAKNQMNLVLGIILLAAGIVAAAYGVYIYNGLQASVMNQLEKAFVGNTEAETQALIFIIAGAVAAVIGLVLVLGKKRRKRRR